jgi:hypothetical protein
MALERRRILRVLGWAYVVYHSLLAAFFVVSAIQDVVPGTWSQSDFQLEMLFVVFVYPAIVPALAACRGLDHCTRTSGHVMQLVAFGIGIAGYVLGWWVITSHVRRRVRGHRGPGVEPA